MKIVKGILLLILVVVLCVVALALTKPNSYHIERSATVATPPATVFAVVNDFHNWESWSPWEHLDPAMKRTFGGAQSGKDATYEWAGNDKVGEGRMTIVESDPDSHVGMRLEFIKPFASTCQTNFTFVPDAEGTKVTWGMDGTNNFMAKVMNVFMNMDKMVGGDFEKGLGQLKVLAESAPPAAADTSASAAPAPAGK